MLKKGLVLKYVNFMQSIKYRGLNLHKSVTVPGLVITVEYLYILHQKTGTCNHTLLLKVSQGIAP